MNERDLRARLADYRAPGEPEARQRAWRVIQAALAAERTAGGRPPRRGRRRLLLAGLAAVAVAVAALTPPGAAVGTWIRDAVVPGRENARPALTRLPADGRLLVNSDSGPWIVRQDGSMRRLGDYEAARWSPRGLFAIATRGRQLVALDPAGEVRWSLARTHRIKDPAWSPDGFRIAYLSGESVRVVAGDGTGDAAVGHDPAVRTPAWQPGREHLLAYARASGSVEVVQADTGRELWRTSVEEPPRQLLWTERGTRLIALFRRRVEVFTAGGGRILTTGLPRGSRAVSAALQPGEATLALVRYRPSSNRSEVVTLPLEGARGRARLQSRRLFAGAGRFADLAWSPDGRWLLVAWPDADQWIFIRSTGVPKIEAVSNITRQFNPGGSGHDAFPTLGGWCCTRQPLSG